jgi:hypothetical protein
MLREHALYQGSDWDILIGCHSPTTNYENVYRYTCVQKFMPVKMAGQLHCTAYSN